MFVRFVMERWPSGFPKVAKPCLRQTPSEEGASFEGVMPFFAYILRSRRDGTHYYGSKADVSKRLDEHNAGKVRYTKGHRPYDIKYVESFETRLDARRRELFFKSIDGYIWLRESKIIEK